jgi:hypothetical protein
MPVLGDDRDPVAGQILDGARAAGLLCATATPLRECESRDKQRNRHRAG